MSDIKAKKQGISRRRLLKGAGYTAAGLTVAFLVGRRFAPVLPSLATPDLGDGAAWIRVSSKGEVSMLSPAHEMGQGSSLGLAQIVAEELNVDVAQIAVRFPSTRDVTAMRFTTGSQAIAVHARPVAEAAARLREELRRRAAALVDLEPEALADASSGFTTADDRFVPYADAVGDTELTLGSDSLPAGHAYTFDETRKHLQIGKLAQQIQAREIVTGKPVFAGDVRRPNMAFGRAIQSPSPDAQVVDVLDEGASSVPGVIRVVIDKAMNLVGVVAETPGALERALKRITVIWDRPDQYDAADVAALVDVDSALAAGGLEHTIADDGGEVSAPEVIDLRFDQPVLHHATQERRCAVAEFNQRDGREVVEVWTGTQDVFVNQKKAAAELGWSADRVTVHAMRVGGGFGGRVLYDVVREAVFLARSVRRPVKVEWSRRDEFLADRTRPPSSHRLRIGASNEGDIIEWRHACVSGHVLLTELMAPQPLLSGMRMVMHDFGAARGLETPYSAKSRHIAMSDVELPFHVGEWRSLGAAPNNFAIECAVDELARTLGKDPVVLRLQNLGPDQSRLKDCLSRVQAMCDARRRPLASGFGRGYACGIYYEQSYVAMAFDLVVDHERQMIRVERCYCALDVGLVISPDQVRAQIEGCAMMAIGQVLMEEAPIGSSGLSAHRFSDYPTPTLEHAPEFEIELIGSRSHPPAGVGQAPIIAAVPALANALRDATGYRAQKLPVRFADLRGASAS